MNPTILRYDHLIENHIEHLKREYHRLCTDTICPQFWFLTTTFVPVEATRDDHIPIPPHRCFIFFERFYVRLLSRLMNNFERKRWLQPLTYLYIDYPFTKRKKIYATLSAIEQFRANQFHFYPEHPETTCHIHSVMLVAPQLVDRFKAIRPSLVNLFQNLGPANCTLHMAPLQTHHDLRRAIFYPSKLLRQPPDVLRGLSKKHWESDEFPDEPRRCDIDLYTVLPKAKSEPVYVKSDWERELETTLREASRGRLSVPTCINT
jgi:hypothetical protein